MSERKRVLPVLNRGIVDPPVFNSHHRARNWAAMIEADPNAAGGLRRTWWEKGRGDFKYIIPRNLTTYAPVEFGADYISTTPRRHPERWYGVVVEIKDNELVIVECSGALEACRLAQELASSVSQ